jgi:hypothetical protein
MRLIALADLAVAISKAGTYRPSANANAAISAISAHYHRRQYYVLLLKPCRRHRIHRRRNRRLISLILLLIRLQLAT